MADQKQTEEKKILIVAGICPLCGADCSNSYEDSEPIDNGRYWNKQCPECLVDFREYVTEEFAGYHCNGIDYDPPRPDFRRQRDELLDALTRIIARASSGSEQDHYSETFGPDFDFARNVLGPVHNDSRKD